MEERIDLSKLYEFLGWHSRPSDEKSLRRFNNIAEYAYKNLDSGPLTRLASKPIVRILDVMAASGIAGVAFARAFVEKGAKVELTLLDARRDELDEYKQWARLAGVGDDKLIVKTIVGDATRIPQVVPGRDYDLVTCWGSSLPHLDAYGLVLFLAGVREVVSKEGVLLIEQHDLLPRLLLTNSFQKVLVEGEGILSIFREYDWKRGVQRRYAYRLPQLEYLGIVESRLWDIAQVTAMTRIFYQHVAINEHYDVNRVTRIILASNPRPTAPSWSELAEEHVQTKRDESRDRN